MTPKAMLPDLERLRQAVEETLTPERYRHSVAVQRRAMHLAKRYGADWYKAGVAGLLHDICKDMAPEVQLNYLRGCGILLDILTLAHPPVWHGITGAEYARRELGVDDREILSAIRCHTTGRRAMSLLEKVVYVADLTSEDRDYPDVDHVRELSERSLNLTVQYCQRFIMGKLVREGGLIMRDAWEAYNYYMNPNEGNDGLR